MTFGRRHAGAMCLALAACRPEFDDRDWLIDSPRVLAVKSEPAEAKPGERVRFTAFLSTAEALPDSDLSWQFCLSPKPLTENNAVSEACLGAALLVPAGVGLSIDAETPPNSCALFGPDTLPGGFRPRDPDNTGGYYQPLRVDLPGAVPVFHLQRVSCSLGGASSDTATSFAKAYSPNQNPSLSPINALISGQVSDLQHIPPGAVVDLTASWPAGSAETFAYYDRETQSVSSQRESLRVSWFVDAGKLDSEVTGRAADDPRLTTDNRWWAPNASGVHHLWLVLRDSRGGVDFARYELTVTR